MIDQILITKNLSKKFEDGRHLHFPDIELEKSKSLLIHGPSGCGKTTLLHIVGTLIRASSGTLCIHGQHLEKLEARKLDQFRGKNIGICLQKPVFIRSLTVLDNLLITQKLSGTAIDKSYCISLLAQLGLSHTSHQFTHHLSQGEQQRLVFIRALIHKPALILADEPSSSLDDHNAERIIELMQEHTSIHRASLIVVSHDARVKKYFNHTLQML
ncbi:MAG: ATP-binding cassette domain-containing protein [Saprospiraceae bacterium]|nr:ATP-binding cassette domain-containing protein [Saprospiraceae bacterium]